MSGHQGDMPLTIQQSELDFLLNKAKEREIIESLYKEEQEKSRVLTREIRRLEQIEILWDKFNDLLAREGHVMTSKTVPKNELRFTISTPSFSETKTTFEETLRAIAHKEE